MSNLIKNKEGSGNGMYLVQYSFRVMVAPGRFGFLKRAALYDRETRVGCDITDIIEEDDIFNFNPESFSVIHQTQIEIFEKYLSGEEQPQGDVPLSESFICDKYFNAIELPEAIASDIRPKLIAAKQAKELYNESTNTLAKTLLKYQNRFLPSE